MITNDDVPTGKLPCRVSCSVGVEVRGPRRPRGEGRRNRGRFYSTVTGVVQSVEDGDPESGPTKETGFWGKGGRME